MERLRALPLATRCVHCQKEENCTRHVDERTVDEPFGRKWDLPEEMAEATETSRDEYVNLFGAGRWRRGASVCARFGNEQAKTPWKAAQGICYPRAK